jgi:hypothetical protein
MVLWVARWSCDAVLPSTVVVAELVVTVTLGLANSGCCQSVGSGASHGVHVDVWCVFCLVTVCNCVSSKGNRLWPLVLLQRLRAYL